MKILSKLPKYYKALVGFVAPGASVIGLAVLPGSDGGTAITQPEWISAVVAAIVTSAAVGATKNQPTTPPSPPSDSEA